jgi:hypothetical protein
MKTMNGHEYVHATNDNGLYVRRSTTSNEQGWLGVQPLRFGNDQSSKLQLLNVGILGGNGIVRIIVQS